MIFVVAIYFILGLVLGSFLNVCIYRLPRRESIVFPRSHCPGCGKSIRPYDNVPVLSYLWLRGRCRDCGMTISLQYPAVELFTGAAFLASALKWQFAPPCFLNSLFMSLLIVLVFVDYQHQILPNRITVPGAAAGIVLSPFQSTSLYLDAVSYTVAAGLSPDDPQRVLPWTASIFGALTAGGSLLAVALAYKAVRRRQGLGMGDVKMMAMVGAFLGWRLALFTVFFGSLIGSVLGVYLMVFRGRDLQHKLAFGTLLGIAAVLSLFFGLPLIRWYTTLGLPQR